ncbi:hypothetical protein FRC09_019846 [Ceratobasidium sp. 395]|nr:hypothetical protein FRC09_019846 [Ceratobasidium sp. 395]
MLTNTVPFTEDDDDMVTRFQRRQVEWSQVSGFGLTNDCIDWMKRMLVPDPNHRMNIEQALNHPWLAEIARESESIRPPPRFVTETPTEAAGSVSSSSASTSFVSSDPPSTQELRELERFNDSMILDADSPAEALSQLGSASMVSGAVSVVTATTHTSDASNLRLVSKFSEDSDASLPIPGKFPHSPMPILNGPHPLRNALQAYETPQNFGAIEVPGAPVRKNQAPPMPVIQDSMQTDSSWDQVSRGIGGESTMHPNLQAQGTPHPLALDSPHTPVNPTGLVVPAGTPNGHWPQPVNGHPIQPPHLQLEQSPQVARQLFNAPAPQTGAPYQFRTRGAALPLRPQQPRERVIPAHPGPMREPLPVAPSSPVVPSPVGSTPTTTTASSGKRTGLEDDSDSELSDVAEDEGMEDYPRGPTGTVRQKRTTGAAPTRVSSRVRARRAVEDVGHVKMPITGTGARRSSRRHTPLKAK